MLASIKISAAAALAVLLLGTPTAITPAIAQSCGHAPKCARLHGDRLEFCMGQRAKAEADCQLRGRGDARGNAGPGRKYRKCKDTAAKYGVDSATSYGNDC